MFISAYEYESESDSSWPGLVRNQSTHHQNKEKVTLALFFFLSKSTSHGLFRDKMKGKKNQFNKNKL